MFLTFWVASYVMSAQGRDVIYLISQSWLRSHQDTFVKDIKPSPHLVKHCPSTG